MNGTLHVTIMDVTAGIREVEIKRPLGGFERKEFTFAGLNEYLKDAKDYCEHKGYELIVSFDKKFSCCERCGYEFGLLREDIYLCQVCMDDLLN